MKNLHKPYGPYERWFKRPIDCILALAAFIVLSPLLFMLTIVGAIVMKGNPFFVQMRPGRIDKETGQEKIFPLIKFRTMTNAKDADGNMLPDEQRLGRYGKLLRSTSLDELGELINIVKGDLAIIGPRPLLLHYLPYYTEDERRRHDVRPGLTGLAQVNGRNYLPWDSRLAMDVKYSDNITFLGDLKIFGQTIKKVIRRVDVSEIRITPLNIERSKKERLVKS